MNLNRKGRPKTGRPLEGIYFLCGYQTTAEHPDSQESSSHLKILSCLAVIWFYQKICQY